MKILVLNCGSSSVKFQLFAMTHEEVIAKGIVEEIGSANAIVRYKAINKDEHREIREVKDHEEALSWVIRTLLHPKYGVIKDESAIVGVGHRVVHGGETFSGSVPITKEVIKKMEECIEFAPLHNPPNLKGIEAATKMLPNSVQAGVFDTAFHQKMPPVAYIYGIPYDIYKRMGIRRYGFHGTSHLYVSHKAAEYMKKPIEFLKIVTCHLGNGDSMACVKGGTSIDTTMGFTPLEGLLMGTRCGDIDPYIPLYLMDKMQMTTEEMNSFLNKKCGLKGISGMTSDMREIEEGLLQGNERCMLAFDIFCYRVRKYIGAYAFAMGGLDAVVFTGGIGEHSPLARQKILSDLIFAGIDIDDDKNEANELRIGKGKVEVFVIPTNEELVIARETRAIIRTVESAKA
ncbi:MAG: acetate kinase [Candidatus Eremiobacteraeota bacterium]|nr:acetate kinase [Candidatus Eremiobacteraeota bacterium]